jgi:hypothetical protein
MRHIIRAIIIISAGVVGAIGTAPATDMTGADLKAFLSGKTIYGTNWSVGQREIRPGSDQLGR